MSKGACVLFVYGQTTLHSDKLPYGFYRREINYWICLEISATCLYEKSLLMHFEG